MKESNTSKCAIIVAPNGATKNRSHHPNLPMSTKEIVEEAMACRQAGATMIHLHARAPDGSHSLDIDINRKLYREVKRAVGDGLIVQLTTEAVNQYSPREQMALIREVQPEAASFALRELFPSPDISESKAFFKWVAEKQIINQIILYDQNDIDRFIGFLDNGTLLNTHLHCLIVLGRHHLDQRSTPWDLQQLNLEEIRKRKIRIAVCAFGPLEQDCLISAMLLGLDVRVGFENNHLTRDGNLAKSNAEQVSNLKNINKISNISFHNAYSFRYEM